MSDAQRKQHEAWTEKEKRAIWREAYLAARRYGFGEADSRDRADIVLAYETRRES